MKQKRISEQNAVSKPWAIALHVTVLCMLSACGGGTPTAEPQNERETAAEAGPSASAAQLSHDANYSIAFAQSVAAGLEDAPESNQSPNFGAALPDTGIPTVNSTDSVVIAPASTGNDNPDGGSPPVTSPFAPIEPSPPVDAPDTDGGSTPTTDPEPVTEPDSGSASGENTNPDGDISTDNPTSQPVTDPSEGTDPDPTPEPEEDLAPSITEPEAPVPSEPDPEPAPVENTETEFFSTTTPGFNGEVLENSIRVTWPVDPNARGYNVYRQAQFVTSVFTEEYIDEDVFDDDYYYEIQAFDNSDTLYYVATGLTVKARTFGRIDPDAPVPNANILDGYELVFSDEFNGTSLDSSKWNTSYLWGPYLVINSEEQFYVDTNNDPDFGFNPFTFDGEHLTINSIETPPELASRAMNQPYLSGVITSYDAFKFTYGYVETRAKVTFGRGYWPAFWLLNAYYVDDKPEIDIMEFIGHDQDVVYHTYHYYDSEGQLRSTESKPSPGVDYTSEFHTYAAEWTPGVIVFYIDGVEVHRVTDPKVSQQEMYVIANTALGGWWAGSPDGTTPFPGEFTLDYIRVYQKSQLQDDMPQFTGPSQVPYADDVLGRSSPSHRPSIEAWPEGYPDGL